MHFREPGREDAETIETGSRAAALGGCTAVVCMPNTDPPIDDAAVVQSILDRGRAVGLCDVRPARCITKGRRGEELAPIGELYDLGVRVFTDDGDCVADALVMRHAFEYAAALPGAVLAQHAEDPALVRGGHMHEGAWSARLGHPGPARRKPSRRSSPATCSSPSAPAAVTTCCTCRARRRPRSCAPPRPTACASRPSARRSISCSPTSRARDFDPAFKMNPPLREQADVDALRAALLDGTIDAIATDHAPHTPESKDVPFEEAPPGMLGVETALAVVLTTLVEPGILTLAQAVGALSWQPARVVGLDADGHGGPVAAGRGREPLRDRSRAHVVGRRRPASRASPATRPGRAGSSPARSATRSWAALRPSATARQPDEARKPCHQMAANSSP